MASVTVLDLHSLEIRSDREGNLVRSETAQREVDQENPYRKTGEERLKSNAVQKAVNGEESISPE